MITTAMLHIFAGVAGVWVLYILWKLWEVSQHPFVQIAGWDIVNFPRTMSIPFLYLLFYIVWLIAG